MRILFLAPAYAGLHIPIIEEMKRQGHKVVWITDESIPYDLRVPRSGLLNRGRCRLNTLIARPQKQIWDKIFQEHATELAHRFDLFFCINGRSLCREIFSYLNKMPNIRKVLYVWDSTTVFDFYKYQEEFNKCYTFDFLDSQNIPGLIYKPLYWINNPKVSRRSQEEKRYYDISIVGSDHDNRFEIVDKILTSIKQAGLSYFFKIQIFKPCFTHVFLYKIRLKYMAGFREMVQKAELRYEQSCKNEIAMKEIIPPNEYTEIMRNSRCVLDTDRDTQTGITPRVIWALAMGKKIISTNRNLLLAPFYNPEQISIIDRNNPIIDIDFIKDDKVFSIHPEIENLKLDNWVKDFIYF